MTAFKRKIPLRPQLPINKGCWFTVISWKERHEEWFNNAGTSVKSKTDEGGWRPDAGLKKDVMLLAYGNRKLGVKCSWSLKICSCCLCGGDRTSAMEKCNQHHSVLFTFVESQKDSSSYVLRWYPEVCANNMTKGEKTATVQVCLINLQSHTFFHTSFCYFFKTKWNEEISV